MRKINWGYVFAGFVLGFLLIFLAVNVFSVGAGGLLPEGVEIFQLPDQGLTCVVWPDGSGECYCSCLEGECYVTPEPIPTDRPVITPTKGPNDPTKTPVIPTVIPETPTPAPEGVFCHCEQGEGEGAEGLKNCHIVKYNNGHAGHEFDYWDYEAPYCGGWHH